MENSNIRGQGTSAIEISNNDQLVEPRDNITVITTARSHGVDNVIIAVSQTGKVLYYNDTYTYYYDVDPSPAGDKTVLYVASMYFNESECPAKSAGWTSTDPGCTQNVVERLNITTGEVTRIYSKYTDWRNWHDVDRVDSEHLLVADIENNRVYIVNITSGFITWEWEIQTDFPVSSGGAFPLDWSHLNNVQYTQGRIIVNLRNQDQVVFIDPKSGLQEDWTLGQDDDHATLYEQHNPDYIPPNRGGPALLVADSENNRVIEYQRTKNGTWEQVWIWRDDQMQWPRDADRLPNGNTLITDSNGNRVLEVDRNGTIVWQLAITTPYDSERLGTGDESATGRSAQKLGLISNDVGPSINQKNNPTRDPFLKRLRIQILVTIKDAIPSRILNSVLFILPQWMDVIDLFVVTLNMFLLLAWIIFELKISSLEISIQRVEIDE